MIHDEIIQLSCHHTMHKNCAAMCHTASCPLCRHPFGAILGPQIQYNTRVRPLMEAVYGLMNPEEITHMLGLFTDVS